MVKRKTMKSWEMATRESIGFPVWLDRIPIGNMSDLVFGVLKYIINSLTYNFQKMAFALGVKTLRPFTTTPPIRGLSIFIALKQPRFFALKTTSTRSVTVHNKMRISFGM